MHNRAVILCTSLLLVACCGGSSGTVRSYEAPTANALVQTLSERSAVANSFLAESRMEYWVGAERIKTTVYVMGERGAKVRFNALNPTGGDVAADLACDGIDFKFVDYNNNCELTGPCTKSAIAQLLRVSLAPDDFLMLATGGTPIIEFTESKVRWDAKNANEVLELVGAGQKQTIVLEGREKTWDILSSIVRDAEGKVEWKLTNKGFSDHKTEDGKSVRLPARTRFEQPSNKAELTIRWDERNINTELSQDKFEIELPGLPRCGNAPAPDRQLHD